MHNLEKPGEKVTKTRGIQGDGKKKKEQVYLVLGKQSSVFHLTYPREANRYTSLGNTDFDRSGTGKGVSGEAPQGRRDPRTCPRYMHGDNQME